MALDINQLRAALAKKADGDGGTENSGFWNLFYPFYKMDFDQKAIFRFLPDLDSDNPVGFIVENKYHQLPINGKHKKLGCSKMYGESCACCEASQKYYDEGNKDLGLKFWRKTDYIAQGLIISSPFEYPVKADENPVRLVSLGKKIYTKIETDIVNGDMENMPHDMEQGYNFNIIKKKQGEYADYSTSSFARASSGIDPDVLSRIELYDLKKYRFAKVERPQMEMMIEAFLTGKSMDEKKDATDAPAVQAASTAPTSTPAVQASQEAPPVAVEQVAAAPAGGTAKLTPAEILRKLKERQQQNKAG